MAEGFYTMTFETPLGVGSGVIYLHDGKAHGGDASMYYRGTYEVEGDTLRASVAIGTYVKQHVPTSVFGVDAANLTVQGNISGSQIAGTATAAQAPGVVMKLTLNRIAD